MKIGFANNFNNKHYKCDWNIKTKVQKWIIEVVWRLFCVSFVRDTLVFPKQITVLQGVGVLFFFPHSTEKVALFYGCLLIYAWAYWFYNPLGTLFICVLSLMHDF